MWFSPHRTTFLTIRKRPSQTSGDLALFLYFLREFGELVNWESCLQERLCLPTTSFEATIGDTMDNSDDLRFTDSVRSGRPGVHAALVEPNALSALALC